MGLSLNGPDEENLMPAWSPSDVSDMYVRLQIFAGAAGLQSEARRGNVKRLPQPRSALQNRRMNKRPQILVVDDDGDITKLLGDYLERFGFEVHIAGNGGEMRAAMSRQSMDLLVLDIMMPGEDGLSLVREIRQSSRVPVVMLTARGDTHDRVVGLEMGADDYMAKPFEPRELVARINTVLRRIPAGHTAQENEGGVVRFDGWELRRDERRLTSPEGVLVPLSNAEYRLLTTFLSMPRRVCSREQLMEHARGRSMENFERSIDLLVSRLRQKLSADADSPSLIRTVRGAGYVFEVTSISPG